MVEVLIRIETQFAAQCEQEGGRILVQDEERSEISFEVSNIDRLLRVLTSITPSFEVKSPELAAQEWSRLRSRLIHGR